MDWAFRAEELTMDLLGPDSNYILAKATANVGKVYMTKADSAKKEGKLEASKPDLDKSEELFKQALTMITAQFTDEHPLAAKYN